MYVCNGWHLWVRIHKRVCESFLRVIRGLNFGRVGLFCVPFYSLRLGWVVLRSVFLNWVELGCFAFRFIHLG